MSRSTTKRTAATRMDALLALPLDRFRRALTRLSAEELSGLEERLTVQRIRNRWARGGFGIARHRSPQELALLGRRETALRVEREARTAAGPALIQLVFPESVASEAAVAPSERQAA